VDDAHGFGVLGESGRGTLEHCGLDAAVNLTGEESADGAAPALLHCATLSKAAGGQGGFVAGSQRFIERARRSGYFAAATPPAAPVAAATARGLALMQEQPELRAQLRANVAHARASLRRSGLPVEDSPVPIIGLHPGDRHTMARIQQSMMQRGIAIAYIPHYSDTSSEGALRIAIFATHNTAMIDQMTEALREVM
jgi:glycine C-acetyltransferase/8-amino-7-oxononanoate synthase